MDIPLTASSTWRNEADEMEPAATAAAADSDDDDCGTRFAVEVFDEEDSEAAVGCCCWVALPDTSLFKSLEAAAVSVTVTSALVFSLHLALNTLTTLANITAPATSAAAEVAAAAVT